MTSEAVIGQDHGNLYHLIQTDLWQQAKRSGQPYYPPTYEAVSATSHTLLPGPALQHVQHTARAGHHT